MAINAAKLSRFPPSYRIRTQMDSREQHRGPRRDRGCHLAARRTPKLERHRGARQLGSRGALSRRTPPSKSQCGTLQ